VSFIEASVTNMVAALSAQGLPAPGRKLTALFLSKMQDPLCDDLVEEMDESGISRSILLIPDFTYTLKDCRLTIEESFLRHREVMLRHPGKFEVFGGVDPRWGNDGIALFERSLANSDSEVSRFIPPAGSARVILRCFLTMSCARNIACPSCSTPDQPPLFWILVSPAPS